MGLEAMKFKFLLFVFLSTFLTAKTITIAVAANVTYAMDDLKKEFNKLYPDIKVQVILGGTGKLVAQIKHNAPYDMLLSANMAYPKALYKSKDAITRPLVYAQGSLVYLSKRERDFSNILDVLKSKKIKRIAVANPKTAPYGKATFEALEKAGVLEQIKPKFVYAESISQTVTYALRATDLGFIAKSTLFSPKMKDYIKGKHWEDVNPKLYTPINQGVVILKHGKANVEVSAFYAFLFSRTAEEIFERFGYVVP
jgi:molybdate transport system substrate-binding protein